MAFNNKKMTVLQQVVQRRSSISLKELLKELGAGYAERTVRRWLAEMVQSGQIEKLGNKRATKYQAPHGKIYEPIEFSTLSEMNFYVQEEATDRRVIDREKISPVFKPESLKVIEQVRRPLYERMPVAYNDAWFDSYLPNITFYLPARVRAQLFSEGKRFKQGDPAGTYAHQIFNRLLIDLSYNSSRLEGNTYSLIETQRLLLEGTGVEGKLSEEKIMILNHKEAIRYLVNNASRLKVDRETICTLHYLLADELVEEHYTGKVRDHGVRIGHSVYIPSEGFKRLQDQLDRVAKKASLIEDPYEQSFFLLVHLSYLQAFTDVNKRTARLAANISLVTHNLVPLSFNDVEREDYTSAMIAIYEIQDVRPLVDVYVFSYQRTCAIYDSTMQSVGFSEVRSRYRQQRRALMREIIVKKLVGTAMKQYVASQIKKLIPKQDQKAFLKDVREGLKEVDITRIAGLGITRKELELWMKAMHRG
ncbi:MAG TPA: Fic family protein [Chlamydiales bacterium]|jgi:Fic family protein